MADTYDDELTQNQAGSQSSPQNFHIPPTLAAHFPPFPAPSHPTDLLTPFSSGSTSNLYRTIVKKPNPISIEINEELHSNAADVALQFAAELRVYRKVGKHQGFVAYLGCVENLGMVLEWVDGPTLLDVLRGPAPTSAAFKAMKEPHKNPSKKRRIIWHNQLVEGLVHLHSFGLNHGDLSLLNIHVETSTDHVKLIDFGRSVSVAGYPCQDLYMLRQEQVAPPKREKTPPPMFNPGGAWVDDRAGRSEERGRQRDSWTSEGGRPKLFDRSTPVPRASLEPPPSNPEMSRPINHATRLLQQHAPAGPALGTHMPVTLSRFREPPNSSRPSSASPLQTRFHLSTSPMSPRTSSSQADSGVYIDRDGMDSGYGYGSEQDDWMQVENYGHHHSSSSGYSRGPGGYPHRRESDDMYGTYGNYGGDRDRDRYHPDFYTPSPSRSRPSSRRQSRSPGPSRLGSGAMYTTHGGNTLHTYHPPNSRSRHMSRSPSRHHGPIPEQYATPQQYSYGHHASPSPHPHSHSQHSHHRHSQSYSHSSTPPGYAPGYPPGRPTPRPPPPPQVKPEPIHPGSRPFCAPEVLRASSGSCIDSRTKMWVDPILADAYSFGIILVCIDLCVLVDIGNEAQRREDGRFPDLSKTTIFTEDIRGYTKPVAAGRERITLDKKMEVPKEDD